MRRNPPLGVDRKCAAGRKLACFKLSAGGALILTQI
jgi:hypothetical protein